MLENQAGNIIDANANSDPTSGEILNSEPSTFSDTGKAPSINEMRSLVGLDPVDESVEENVPTLQVSSLVDDEDFAEGEEEVTQRKLWQKPVPKMLAVALPLGVLAFIAGFILINLTGMDLVSEPDATEEVEDSENLNALEEERQREEIARLKTSNALGNQASVLDNQPERRTEIRPATEPTPTRVSAPTEVRQPQPAAQPAPTPPRAPVQRSRPVAVSRAPISPRQPSPRVVQASPPPAQSVPVPAQSVRSQSAESRQSDPFEEWQKLAALGSYGQVSAAPITDSGQAPGIAVSQLPASNGNEPIPVLVSNSSRESATNPTLLASDNSSSRPLPKTMEDYQPAAARQEVRKRVEPTQLENFSTGEAPDIVEEAPTALVKEPMEENETVALAEDSYQAGADFIMNNSDQPVETRTETVILPGISARGEVIAPVAWAGDVQSTSGAVELTEDLISNDSVIMPAGTQLIVALNEMSESGMTILRVTSIILPQTGYEHMQIPASAISIQGSNGSVLMAKDISGADSELRRLDLGQAFLGALGQVGSILNRPSSSSNAVGLTGSVSSTEYDSPNILGAVLEGSAGTLINERSARNQERADELQQRPPVWVLTEGTGIEIFVNQAVAMEGE